MKLVTRTFSGLHHWARDNFAVALPTIIAIALFEHTVKVYSTLYGIELAGLSPIETAWHLIPPIAIALATDVSAIALFGEMKHAKGRRRRELFFALFIVSAYMFFTQVYHTLGTAVSGGAVLTGLPQRIWIFLDQNAPLISGAVLPILALTFGTIGAEEKAQATSAHVEATLSVSTPRVKIEKPVTEQKAIKPPSVKSLPESVEIEGEAYIPLKYGHYAKQQGDVWFVFDTDLEPAYRDTGYKSLTGAKRAVGGGKRN